MTSRAVPGLILLLVVLMCSFIWADENQRGAGLYNNKCALCHGMKGDGKGPASTAFHPAPVAFNDPEFWKKDPQHRINDSIIHGRGKMPAFPLTPEEIKAISDYITNAFKK